MRIFFSLTAGVMCAFLIACGGGSNHSTPPNTIVSTGLNVAPIAVNGGPTGNYPDAAFASVTVCEPGTSTCQTIDDVLVDTGSFGLRVLSSALTVSLPQQKASDGNPVAECLTFLASYTWGPVQTADVQIAGEKASSAPIQVLSDTDFPAPSSCTSSGFQSADTLDALGANGILGVGLAEQDCGSPCPANADQYYECPSSGCQPIAQASGQQVINPVALFTTDNNGVIVELPAASSGGESSVSGSLVFGIGTQSNNGLGGATVYTAPAGSFTTSYNGQSYPGSFIDSGSNGYFFLDSSLTGLTNCASNDQGFYCSSGNFTATNQGSNAASGSVKFSIASAATLFANPSNFVLGDLGGPSSNSVPFYFDWGLPFFFGRNVFVAIVGASTPGGAGPYWAY
jgi:predicted aspartyl protease